MSFIVLQDRREGPTRFNIGQIVRYMAVPGGGAMVHMLGHDRGHVVDEAPDEIDELVRVAGGSIAAAG